MKWLRILSYYDAFGEHQNEIVQMQIRLHRIGVKVHEMSEKRSRGEGGENERCLSLSRGGKRGRRKKEREGCKGREKETWKPGNKTINVEYVRRSHRRWCNRRCLPRQE